MKKILLILGLLALITGCSTTKAKHKNIDSSTQSSPLTKDICKECYSKLISLDNSNSNEDSKTDIPKKVYNKWGDRELNREEVSTKESAFCNSISESYLKENCEFIK